MSDVDGEEAIPVSVANDDWSKDDEVPAIDWSVDVEEFVPVWEIDVGELFFEAFIK